MIILNILGIILIIYEAIQNKKKTEEQISELNTTPKNRLIDYSYDTLSELLIIGIVIVCLGIFQFLIVIVTLTLLSNKTIKKYESKIKKLLERHNILLKEKGLKYFVGENCMWLELRLDFKYDEILEKNPNSASWEFIGTNPDRKPNISKQYFNDDKKYEDALETEKIMNKT